MKLYISKSKILDIITLILIFMRTILPRMIYRNQSFEIRSALINEMSSKFLYIIVIFCLLKLLFKKFSYIEILSSIIIIILCIIGQNFSLIAILIILLSFKRSKFEDLLKHYFLFNLITIISIIALIPWQAEWGNTIINQRYDLGFGNPNTASQYVFSLVLSYFLIISNRENKIFHNIIILILVFSTYYFTGSRNIIFSIFVFYLVLNISKFKNTFTLSKSIFNNFFIILSILSFFLIIKSESQMLNVMLSYRPAYLAEILRENGISLIPQKLIIDYPIDNSYMYRFLQYGIIIYGFFLIFSRKLLNQLFIFGNKYQVAVVTASMFYAFFESSFFNITTSISLYLLIINYYEVRKIK